MLFCRLFKGITHSGNKLTDFYYILENLPQYHSGFQFFKVFVIMQFISIPIYYH